MTQNTLVIGQWALRVSCMQQGQRLPVNVAGTKPIELHATGFMGCNEAIAGGHAISREIPMIAAILAQMEQGFRLPAMVRWNVVAGVQIATDQNRHIRSEGFDLIQQITKLRMAVGSASVAFQMGRNHADWSRFCWQNRGYGHPATDPRLVRISLRIGVEREPMSFLIQAQQGQFFKWHRLEDAVAVPAFCVEVVMAENPFGRAA